MKRFTGSYLNVTEDSEIPVKEVEASLGEIFSKYCDIYGVGEDEYTISVSDAENNVVFRLLKRIRVPIHYAKDSEPLQYRFLSELGSAYAEKVRDRSMTWRNVLLKLNSVEAYLKTRKEWAEAFMRKVEQRGKAVLFSTDNPSDLPGTIGFGRPHAVVLHDRYFSREGVHFSALFSLGFRHAVLVASPVTCQSTVYKGLGVCRYANERRIFYSVCSEDKSYEYVSFSSDHSLFFVIPYTKKSLEAAVDFMLYEGYVVDDYVLRKERSILWRLLPGSRKRHEEAYDSLIGCTRLVTD